MPIRSLAEETNEKVVEGEKDQVAMNECSRSTVAKTLKVWFLQ